MLRAAESLMPHPGGGFRTSGLILLWLTIFRYATQGDAASSSTHDDLRHRKLTPAANS